MRDALTARLMRASSGLRAQLGKLLSVGLLLGLLACGTTDRDRIDEFVRAVSGELNAERVQHVLSKYIDLERQSLVLTVFGDTRVYDREQVAKLTADAERRLSPLYGRTLSILRQQVQIAGGEAVVDLQLFSRGGGGSVRYVLVKRRGELWLISELSLSN